MDNPTVQPAANKLPGASVGDQTPTDIEASSAVARLIAETPDLRVLVKRIKDSRESEFEKKVRLNDLYQVLTILAQPLPEEDEEDLIQSTDKLLPVVQKYFDCTWLANAWLTDAFVGRFLGIQLRHIAYQVEDTELSGKKTRKGHMTDVFVTGWLCVLLIFGGFWAATQKIWWIAPVAAGSLLFLVYKLTQYAWVGTRDADQLTESLGSLRALGDRIDKTRDEVLSGYYDPAVISQRLSDLENKGLYIHSFLHRLLRVGIENR